MGVHLELQPLKHFRKLKYPRNCILQQEKLCCKNDDETYRCGQSAALERVQGGQRPMRAKCLCRLTIQTLSQVGLRLAEREFWWRICEAPEGSVEQWVSY
jgi:hypothetical protein